MLVLMILAGPLRSDPCMSIEQAAHEIYSDSTCYVFQSCGFNVVRALESLEARDFWIEQFDVVFLNGEMKTLTGIPNMRAKLLPNRSKEFSPYGGQLAWFFHFIILEKWSGRIFDYEYGSQLTPVREYVENMFARQGENPAENIAMKRIGAQQYLEMIRHHNIRGNHEMEPVMTRLRNETPEWPEGRLQDLVNAYP